MEFFKKYIRVIAIASLISLILQYGFTIPYKYTPYVFALNLFIALSFALNAIFRLVVSPHKIKTIRAYIFEYILLFFIFLQFIIWQGLWTKLAPYLQQLNIFSLTNLYIVCLQVYILLSLVLKVPSLNAKLASLHIPPPLMVVISFSLVILFGTFLLLLPRAAHTRISFIDALFTATSAVCVTGLVVFDIGKQFTWLGQFFILLLIQIGGLGIMTFTSFFALVLRGELGVKERMVLGDVLNFRTLGQLKALVRSIFVTTFFIELSGAVLMYIGFIDYPNINNCSTLWNAIFHSVSAFCNAGFSLFSQNFIHFVKDPYLCIVTVILIISGGLGFVVIRDLLKAAVSCFKLEHQAIRLSLQTRIVLKTSFILILIGLFMFLVIENNNVLSSFTLFEKIVASLFQSVTARTCGFNTVEIGSLALPTLLVLMFLMFIGASPGGTGGGIKTTTFSILAGLIRSRLRGTGDVVLSKGAVSNENIFEAIIVFSLSLSVVFLSIFLLLFFESFPLHRIVFEVVSAFGTVGLSTGITSQLSPVGKLIIIMTMFVGRIGPFSIVLAIPRRHKEAKVKHIKERIMVG